MIQLQYVIIRHNYTDTDTKVIEYVCYTDETPSVYVIICKQNIHFQNDFLFSNALQSLFLLSALLIKYVLSKYSLNSDKTFSKLRRAQFYQCTQKEGNSDFRFVKIKII